MESPPTHISFGRFELDLARGQLRREGDPVDLSAKPLSLLVHLAVHRDRVVSKQELFDELWPDVVVGEAALSSAIKDLRRALGDDGAQMRVIRTYRRRGYRFVADAVSGDGAIWREREESPSARPAGMVLRDRDDQSSWYRPERISDTKVAPPIVGREPELQRLREALTTAESGQPRFMLIEGDAGSGKTGLLEEFVGRECKYVDVAIGRARGDTARPYLAFAEAISSWVSDREVRLEELVGKESRTLSRLLHPAQLDDLDDLRSRLIGERERSELFSGLSGTLVSLARRQPTVLVLEDMQWADVSTLDLLEHLVLVIGEAAREDAVPMLIVATVRPDASPEHRASLDRMLRDSYCERLELARLRESAIAEIMDALGLENPPAAWVSSVSELSDGNPLFVQQITRRLLESGEGALELPWSLEAALRERLAELDDDCREVLTVAALIGDGFGLLALSAACRRSEEQTLKLLDHAAQAGIVRGARRAFRFEQRSWSHLLKAGLSAEQRRELHAKIADVLEDLYASAGGEHAIEIASHVLAASLPSDDERILHYGRLAGEQSLAMYAWREAGRFFAAAAEADVPISEPDRAGLHLRAGIAFNHDWDARSCIHHYERAATGFRHCGDVRGVAWALMYMTRARLTLAFASYGDQIDIGELETTADGLRESDPALRSMLLEMMSEVAWMSGSKTRAFKLSEEALVIGHNLENDEVSHHACMGLALARFQDLRIREALESWREAQHHGRALHASWLSCAAATRTAMALVHLGRFAEADSVLDEALATARRAHNLGELSFGCAQRAGLRAARGTTEGALVSAAESINMMSRSRYPWGGPYALLARMLAHLSRGEVDVARASIRDLVEPGFVFDEPTPAVQLLVAVSDLWIDTVQSDAVDETLLGNLVTLVCSAGHDSYVLGPACALVHIASRNGCLGLAEPLEPFLRLALDRSVRFSTGWILSIDRMLAEFAIERGAIDDGQELLQSSLDLCSENQAYPELIETHLTLARLAEQKSDPESTQAVQRHRDQALEIAQQVESAQLSGDLLRLRAAAHQASDPSEARRREPR